ncbi:MAG TPA: GGDEF domain-containing protein, partial [Burkholderiaceae bacterium]|nr:GGDEF domain-containing protein [Burkholderiaceae bacterium]
MSTPSPDLEHDAPAWLPWFGQFVTRRGLRASLTLLCGIVWLLALGLSQLLITLLGRGDRLVATLCASACALGITGVFGYLFLRLVQFQDQTRQRVNHHATLDPLTDTFNRRHFLKLVDREWARAKRYNMDCALLLMDVDHFKKVNDVHGHLCGDRLLREIARVSGETLRQADVLARFGGEEFAVFLPHT